MWVCLSVCVCMCVSSTYHNSTIYGWIFKIFFSIWLHCGHLGRIFFVLRKKIFFLVIFRYLCFFRAVTEEIRWTFDNVTLPFVGRFRIFVVFSVVNWHTSMLYWNILKIEKHNFLWIFNWNIISSYLLTIL